MANQKDSNGSSDTTNAQMQEILVKMSDIISGMNTKEDPYARDYGVGYFDPPPAGEERIFLPAGMTIPNAMTTLRTAYKQQEEMKRVLHYIEGYPLLGAWAMMEALREIFGTVFQQATMSMFGPNPPMMVEMQVSPTEHVTVPWGKITIATFDKEEYLQTSMDIDGRMPRFIIAGEVRQKHEKLIARVAQRAREILKERHPWRGQVLELDLEWIENGNFDPINDQPKFVEIHVDPDRLKLDPHIDQQVRAELFGRIRYPEVIDELGVSKRTGVLLSGLYGTGKSLTAKVAAHYAQENGWTFLYVKNPNHSVHAMRLAQGFVYELYGAVVFVEDIDLLGTDRSNTNVNGLLNEMSGLGSDLRILTVFTTNHIDKIAQAMRRGRRIDVSVEYPIPSHETIVEMVRYYAPHLAEKYTLEEMVAVLGEPMHNFVGAFVESTIDAAKLHAHMMNEEMDVKHIANAAVARRQEVDAALGIKPPSDVHPAVAAHNRLVEDVLAKTGK